ncbi:cob(I)yrinic acid a,c-diamide adenosyltransferase [Konateibacter massiliensis]|uniref:cob(I)yrinic acid a,c-diamide adenosyltransferase n=1 Tax=Konateibacter massiliensis TaxID=2002841 RepID=UPI000C159E97|nr:cob(I)yrinic acid a,c-diamide adenosyltransferase [Konateibacter massiliensis]
METGKIHIYCGDGKGKTTSAMGLAIRAAGFGMKVLIYQFMKDNTTSERNVLNQISNITIVDGLEQEKFSFQMTEQEKAERLRFYTDKFKEITRRAEAEQFDMLLLDEVIYTIRAGLISEEMILSYLKEKPEDLEVVMTGNSPSAALLDAADYVSEIKKIKHPFDQGLSARYGIEK